MLLPLKDIDDVRMTYMRFGFARGLLVRMRDQQEVCPSLKRTCARARRAASSCSPSACRLGGGAPCLEHARARTQLTFDFGMTGPQGEAFQAVRAQWSKFDSFKMRYVLTARL